MIKKCLLVLLLASILIMGSGCMNMLNSKDEHDPNVIKDECISFLHKKYNMEFKPDSLEQADWAYNYDTFYCHTKDKKFKNIKVHRYYKNGTYTFSDNFLGIYLKGDYTEIVNKVVKKYFPDSIVTAYIDSDLYFPDKYTTGTTVSELIRNEYVTGSTYVFVKYDGNDKLSNLTVEKLKQSLIDNRLFGTTIVYKMLDGKFEKINLNNLNEIFDNPQKWHSDRKDINAY